MRPKATMVALLLFLGAASTPLFTSESPSLVKAIDQAFAVHHFGEVAISPDGRHVAWVELLREANGTESRNSIVRCMPLSGPASTQRISALPGRLAAESSLAWAPDSKRLALLSDAQEPSQRELYIAECSSVPAKRMTNLKGFLAEPRWSPDGKTIAFLFAENAPRASGPLEAEALRTGEVEEHLYEQRLITVDVATAKVKEVSPSDLYVYEFDWAPDSGQFVATAAHGAGDDNWWLARLYIMSATSGETKAIYAPKLQIALPRWSPDGKNIAFISGLMSDEVSTGGDIFIISAKGDSLRNVTPGIKGSPSWLAWSSADQLLFVQTSQGNNLATTLRVSDGSTQNLWSTEDFFTASMWIGSLSVALDGKTSAGVRSSFREAPEVWAGPTGSWTQVTHLNDGVIPPWGEFTSLNWKSESFSVQGWLVLPQHYDKSRKYPMVVAVHGGPASIMTAAWPKHFFNPVLLSNQGYFVLLPNPRGSFGQGTAFTEANVKDFGYGDFRDILRGVDYVVEKFPIDRDRIGITGWSYGGFMSMWAVTQSDVFRAAVAGAGLSNWQSYYGENEIDQWMVPYFGASVYDDPAVYARSSPINFIKNVKTPTLMLVGERDGEVPPPQSFEFWHALKTLGVETKLVVYPEEGHQFHDPMHRRDANLRTLGWFNKYLQSTQNSH